MKSGLDAMPLFLLDNLLIISQVINQVTCYKIKCCHWLKYSLNSLHGVFEGLYLKVTLSCIKSNHHEKPSIASDASTILETL